MIPGGDPSTVQRTCTGVTGKHALILTIQELADSFGAFDGAGVMPKFVWHARKEGTRVTKSRAEMKNECIERGNQCGEMGKGREEIRKAREEILITRRTIPTAREQLRMTRKEIPTGRAHILAGRK